jgi:hypothetical protein
VQEPKNPGKSAQKRLALLIVAGVPLGLLVVLITASIVVDLFANRRLIPARSLDAGALGTCNRAVRGLLEGLVDETTRLERSTLVSGVRDLSSEWDGFALRWQSDWEQVGARCGFGELEGTGLGASYDRMAWVHRNLPTTKLKLHELVAHFARDVGVDVTELRDALDKSRADLPQVPGQGNDQ